MTVGKRSALRRPGTGLYFCHIGLVAFAIPTGLYLEAYNSVKLLQLPARPVLYLSRNKWLLQSNCYERGGIAPFSCLIHFTLQLVTALPG